MRLAHIVWCTSAAPCVHANGHCVRAGGGAAARASPAANARSACGRRRACAFATAGVPALWLRGARSARHVGAPLPSADGRASSRGPSPELSGAFPHRCASPELLHRRPDLLHRRPELLHRRPELLHRRPLVRRILAQMQNAQCLRSGRRLRANLQEHILPQFLLIPSAAGTCAGVCAFPAFARSWHQAAMQTHSPRSCV